LLKLVLQAAPCMRRAFVWGLAVVKWDKQYFVLQAAPCIRWAFVWGLAGHVG